MNKEINKIISWIEMGYTRLNYKEELLLVNYIRHLQQENKKYKEVIEKVIEKLEEVKERRIMLLDKEKGEFDFEVSAMVQELTQEEYRELKSMLITAIGTMEEMRRNK
ncbi:MAG: hypothetical protein SOZ53_02220 [Candidatus Onthovivens sp.]|nr:hypothetical protein [Candidatus Onthovivens sp.]